MTFQKQLHQEFAVGDRCKALALQATHIVQGMFLQDGQDQGPGKSLGNMRSLMQRSTEGGKVGGMTQSERQVYTVEKKWPQTLGHSLPPSDQVTTVLTKSMG